MALIECPECEKPVSEHAVTCPGCGLGLTPSIVADQKAKLVELERLAASEKAKNEQRQTIGAIAIFGGMMVGWAICSGMATPRSSSSSTWSPPAAVPSVKSSYASDEARLQELGDKVHPTQAEIREFLDIDAQQSVREGSMTRSEFERYTGRKYPD